MQKNIARTVILCVAFMALVVGLTTNRILSPNIMTRDQMNDAGMFVYEVPRRINAFALTDQHGNAFDNSSLKGKWSLLFFGYTYCPDICPITLATIRQFEQLLAEEDEDIAAQLQVAMISVDPERDTQEKLADYMAFFNEAYIGARGEYIDVFNLARQLNIAFGYQPQDEGEYLVSHSGEIVLINPDGHFQGFFKVPHNPENMTMTFQSVFNTRR